MTISRSFWQNTSGAAAVEFSLVALPFLAMSIGIIEVGRSISVQSDIIHAADKAERAIMLNNMNSDGSDEDIRSLVDPVIRKSIQLGHPEKVRISVSDQTVDGENFRKLTISYPVGAMIPGLDNFIPDITVNRLIPAD